MPASLRQAIVDELAGDLAATADARRMISIARAFVVLSEANLRAMSKALAG